MSQHPLLQRSLGHNDRLDGGNLEADMQDQCSQTANQSDDWSPVCIDILLATSTTTIATGCHSKARSRYQAEASASVLA
ncbi:hypothetical protein [Prochlorococcus sp. MIT 1306]|uniref:hypothetical protein n=1 Tax=Prochlorococcus sp. MIT 1306 TaxID=1799667 RepID=UPI0012E84812|nr:hypothetical protein [Prochlorococcus sp. MIT 1306]